MTVFGHRGAQVPCYKSSITMLSSAVSDYVCARVEGSTSLAVSLTIASPYLGVGGRALSEEEILCLLYPGQSQTINTTPTLDLLCAGSSNHPCYRRARSSSASPAAVSSYIISRKSALLTMSALLKAEIWDALRDALILTIERRFVGDDEALAVLVTPMIGHALSGMSVCGDTVFSMFERSRLVLCADDMPTVEHATKSSWTSSLLSQLATLGESETSPGDHVWAVLRSRLVPAVQPALNLAIENRNAPHEVSRRLVSCRSLKSHLWSIGWPNSFQDGAYIPFIQGLRVLDPCTGYLGLELK